MAGAAQKADEPICDINITPLVDICLVLVIIFMAVAPFAMTVGIKVLESRAKAAEGKTTAEDNVNVRLALDGKITVNGKAVGDEGLQAGIEAALRTSKDKMVIVTADDKNRVGQVVEILDLAQQAGAQKLTIMKTQDEKPAAEGEGT